LKEVEIIYKKSEAVPAVQKWPRCSEINRYAKI
jgi:hypothetical protein